MLTLLTILAGYFIGAIPFGYLVARAVRGIDIRRHGSGNIGATNVGRVLGLKWFFLVFLLDFAKALIPIFVLIQGFLPQAVVPESWPASGVAALLGLTILLGNMFPIYIGFKGGKGAATGTGVILPLAPIPTIVALGTFIIFCLVTRYVSLSSIAAALAIVITQVALLGRDALTAEAAPITWLCIVGAALVIFRHRGNIVRLLRGTENKIGRKSHRPTSTI